MNWKSVPNKYKPVPFWSWNDKLDAEEIRRQIEEFKSKGYGGHFMHSRVGLVTKYMSEEWMRLISEGIKKSEELGLDAWLYDEDKWPSGYAGGEVPLASDKYGSRNLLLLRAEELTENDSVINEYDADGMHFYIAVRVEPHIYKSFNGTCYIDAMNTDAVGEFIRLTHDKYKERFGDQFGAAVPGIFTDEPCYHMFNLTKVPSLPWSDGLTSYFKDKCGYSLKDNICSLFFAVGDYKKIRYDFFKCTSDLFMEAYTKQYSRWCKNNNMKMTGHYMCEDTIATQTQFIGHAMPHYVYMDIPGVDKLKRNIEQDVTLKQLTSVTDQFGKKQALCEIFGCIGHNSAFFDRKWIADWAAVMGISLINGHLALYSMRGERKRDYPSNLFFQQPWWDEEKEFSDYISRICAMAAIGKSTADVLVIHPIESGWCEYSAYNAKLNLPNGTETYNKAFETLTRELIAGNVQFHYGDEEILSEYGQIEDGMLTIGNITYRCILIPKCLTLRSSTVDLLSGFKGEIIGVASDPKLIDAKETARKVTMTKRVQRAREAVSYLTENIVKVVKITEKRSGTNASSVRVSWRKDDNDEYLFFANTNKKRAISCEISVPTEKVPYLIDLHKGNEYALDYTRKGNTISFDVRFEASGSMALGLTDMEKTLENVSYLTSGVVFRETVAGRTMKPLKIKVIDNNVLPLEYVDFEINGRQIFRNEHISAIWHPHFYNAPEGSPFKVTYRFNVDRMPESDLTAVVELAENLDCIEINGKAVEPLKHKGESGAFDQTKSWLDVGFTKIPLGDAVRLGENILTIYGKKHNNIIGTGSHISVDNANEHYPTEAETAYIIGDFSVSNTDNTSFAIDKAYEPNVQNLTDDGYPFYAGRVCFSFLYKCDAACKKTFKITNARFASARVTVNGRLIDTVCYEPYMFDAELEDGGNIIEIEAATTLYNLMGPNWNVNMPEFDFVGPNQFVDKNSFSDRLTLMPFGFGGIAEVNMH